MRTLSACLVAATILAACASSGRPAPEPKAPQSKEPAGKAPPAEPAAPPPAGEGPAAPAAQAPPKKAQERKEKQVAINWLFFQYRRGEAAGKNWLLPFYTYSYDTELGERDFTFWPLVSGFEISPTNEYWFSLPLLTLFGGSRTQKTERSYFASIPLLTFSSSEKAPWLETQEFVSLPMLTVSGKHVFHGSRGTVARESWLTPVASSERVTRTSKDKPGEELEIVKRSLLVLSLGEEDRVSMADLNRWDRDREIRMVNLLNFPLLSFARFQGRYPGAPYLDQLRVTPRAAETQPKRTVRADDPVTSEWSFLGPLVSFRTNVKDETRWEFLPLLHYRAQGDRETFRVLPLFLEIQGGKPRFAPHTSAVKLWPLLYWNEYTRRVDILWPLAHWRDDEIEDRVELRVRFLFRYQRKADYSALALAGGLLLDRHQDEERTSTRVLLGYLFSSQTQVEEELVEWDLLRGLLFGVTRRKGEEPTYRFLFVRVGGKKKAPPPKKPDAPKEEKK